jgi:hypothetical protein
MQQRRCTRAGPSTWIRSGAILRRRQISWTHWPRFLAGDCDADGRDLRARRTSFPTGRQLELFCYRLERLTSLGTDPCQRKGTIFPSKGQIVAFSLPGGTILGGDGALDEEGE